MKTDLPLTAGATPEKPRPQKCNPDLNSAQFLLTTHYSLLATRYSLLY